MGQRWRCAAVTLFQLTFLDEAGGGGEGLGEGPGVTRQLAPGLLYIDTDKKQQQQNTINTNNKVSTRCGYMGKCLSIWYILADSCSTFFSGCKNICGLIGREIYKK